MENNDAFRCWQPAVPTLDPLLKAESEASPAGIHISLAGGVLAVEFPLPPNDPHQLEKLIWLMQKLEAIRRKLYDQQPAGVGENQ